MNAFLKDFQPFRLPKILKFFRLRRPDNNPPLNSKSDLITGGILKWGGFLSGIALILDLRIFKMILRISKCAHSIPGKISDRCR